MNPRLHMDQRALTYLQKYVCIVIVVWSYSVHLLHGRLLNSIHFVRNSSFEDSVAKLTNRPMKYICISKIRIVLCSPPQRLVDCENRCSASILYFGSSWAYVSCMAWWWDMHYPLSYYIVVKTNSWLRNVSPLWPRLRRQHAHAEQFGSTDTDGSDGHLLWFTMGRHSG